MMKYKILVMWCKIYKILDDAGTSYDRRHAYKDEHGHFFDYLLQSNMPITEFA